MALEVVVEVEVALVCGVCAGSPQREFIRRSVRLTDCEKSTVRQFLANARSLLPLLLVTLRMRNLCGKQTPA